MLQADEYVSTKEFAILYTQLQEVYLKYDQSTTPEQKASLAKRAYELTTRLQAGAAKYTAKKYSGNYYVSIGDSTLTGYGLDEYVPGMNNGEGQVLGTEAPVLLAQKLFGNDYQSHFKKLDKGGLRVDDLLVWLGEEEFIDDFYNRYTMDANAVVSQTEYYQVLFESEIKKADLITVALGGGNITTFIAQQINALKSGSELIRLK